MQNPSTLHSFQSKVFFVNKSFIAAVRMMEINHFIRDRGNYSDPRQVLVIVMKSTLTNTVLRDEDAILISKRMACSIAR